MSPGINGGEIIRACGIKEEPLVEIGPDTYQQHEQAITLDPIQCAAALQVSATLWTLRNIGENEAGYRRLCSSSSIKFGWFSSGLLYLDVYAILGPNRELPCNP